VAERRHLARVKRQDVANLSRVSLLDLGVPQHRHPAVGQGLERLRELRCRQVGHGWLDEWLAWVGHACRVGKRVGVLPG
jgi:hypothetical protein